MGRKTGRGTLEFFYRAGRGWYTQIDSRMTALCDGSGEPLRRKDTPVADLREAKAYDAGQANPRQWG